MANNVLIHKFLSTERTKYTHREQLSTSNRLSNLSLSLSLFLRPVHLEENNKSLHQAAAIVASKMY